MVYAFLKVWVRISLSFFSKRIYFNKPDLRTESGPLLLACNHPNSFLDAVLLGVLLKNPVHFITRGDVFKSGAIQKFLESLNMIPIFRLRDGKDKLTQNDEAFTKSMEVLRNNGILLIFVEGFCINQTELQRPLKKGAPRILLSCWQEGIPARVLPVWLRYSSYNRFGKTIDILFGNVFGQSIAEGYPHASGILKINAETENQLLALGAVPFKKSEPGIALRIVLFLPAMLGAILHAPLYLPIVAVDKKISKNSVHYDSIMLAFLTFLYPVYLILIAVVGCGLTRQWWPLTAFIVFPMLAQAYLNWKK